MILTIDVSVADAMWRWKAVTAAEKVRVRARVTERPVMHFLRKRPPVASGNDEGVQGAERNMTTQ